MPQEMCLKVRDISKETFGLDRALMGDILGASGATDMGSVNDAAQRQVGVSVQYWATVPMTVSGRTFQNSMGT